MQALRYSILENITLDGENSPLLDLGSRRVAKRAITTKNARNEQMWGRFLYKRGFWVPKIWGLVMPEDDPEGIIDAPYIVMQTLEGEDTTHLTGRSREEALRQYKLQMGRVLNFNIYPVDSLDRFPGRNSRFNSMRGITYLHDFESWRKGNPREIERMRSILNSKSFWELSPQNKPS